MENATKELEILEQIHSTQPQVRQRALAEVVGLSLGMTNSILKRLADKGWITVRKVNGRNLAYAVTPEGMEVIASRSYKYLKRTVKSVVLYRRKIEELARNVGRGGYDSILLIGKSDLDFIVEYACGRIDIGFQKANEKPRETKADSFILYSENIRPDGTGEGPTEGDKPGGSALAGEGYLQAVLKD
jgi:predicted transcriptional regulator